MSLGSRLREARRKIKQTPSEVAAATRMKIQIVEALEQEDFSKIAAPIYGKGFIRLYAEHVGLDPQPLISEYMSRFVEGKTPSLISEETPVQEEEPVAEPEGQEPEGEDYDLFSEIDRGPGAREARRGNATAGTGRPNVRTRNVGELIAGWARAVRGFREQLAESRRAAREHEDDQEPEPDSDYIRRQKALPPIGFDFREYPLRSASLVLGLIVILVFVVSGLSRCVGGKKNRLPPGATPTQDALRLAVDPPEPYFE
jgi:hypothetical protein